jgi:hypothetical protein
LVIRTLHCFDDIQCFVLRLTAAKEVALELNSLSKTFNMAGWEWNGVRKCEGD